MKKRFSYLIGLICSMLIIVSCTDYTGNEVTEPDYGLDRQVTLKVIAPTESVNIKPGSTYTIQWEVPSAIRNVSVSLYRKGVFQSVLFENIPNNGSVDWNVPQDIFNSVHYSIKVFDPRFPDIYTAFSKNFYIKADW